MEVSMNGLRNQLISNYNSLVVKLNNSVADDGYVEIDSHDIERNLDQIRSCIVTLAFSYQEDDPDFTVMSEDTIFETFNPQVDEMEMI